MKTVLKELASAIAAIRNCEKTGNDHWREIHADRVAEIVKNFLPSGSGFDSGCTIDVDDIRNDGRTRILIETSFHHMDDAGFYDGWTDHVVTVRPDLTLDFALTISGRDRNGIKDYIADTFNAALNQERN